MSLNAVKPTRQGRQRHRARMTSTLQSVGSADFDASPARPARPATTAPPPPRPAGPAAPAAFVAAARRRERGPDPRSLLVQRVQPLLMGSGKDTARMSIRRQQRQHDARQGRARVGSATAPRGPRSPRTTWPRCCTRAPPCTLHDPQGLA